MTKMIKTKKTGYYIALILTMLCTACQSSIQSTATNMPTASATPAIAFPRIQQDALTVDYAAAIAGRLMLDGRCIRIINQENPDGLGVLWYHRFTFDGSLITDTRTNRTTKIGDLVKLGGGEDPNGNIALDTNDNPCKAPYWLASGLQ